MCSVVWVEGESVAALFDVRYATVCRKCHGSSSVLWNWLMWLLFSSSGFGFAVITSCANLKSYFNLTCVALCLLSSTLLFTSPDSISYSLFFLLCVGNSIIPTYLESYFEFVFVALCILSSGLLSTQPDTMPFLQLCLPCVETNLLAEYLSRKHRIHFQCMCAVLYRSKDMYNSLTIFDT